MTDANGWSEYQKLVLDKLESQGRDIREIRDEVQRIQIEQGIQRKKVAIGSGVAGAVGGGIVAFIVRLLTR